MAKQELLFDAFTKAIALVSTNTTPQGLMLKLRNLGFQKIELMIIDSAVKGMPLHNLHKTLILEKETYIEIIENCIIKLLDVSEENEEEDTFYLEEHIKHPSNIKSIT